MLMLPLKDHKQKRSTKNPVSVLASVNDTSELQTWETYNTRKVGERTQMLFFSLKHKANLWLYVISKYAILPFWEANKAKTW